MLTFVLVATSSHMRYQPSSNGARNPFAKCYDYFCKLFEVTAIVRTVLHSLLFSKVLQELVSVSISLSILYVCLYSLSVWNKCEEN